MAHHIEAPALPSPDPTMGLTTHPGDSNTNLPTTMHPSQPNDQLGSPLFARLPLELRGMIFTELFGNRRVHLEFMHHPLRADKVGNRRRWRHGICEDEVSTPFERVVARQHYCLTASRRRVLDISMLFTCRRA
jgi:hypothetical protein